MTKIRIKLVTVGHLPDKFDKSIIKSRHFDVFTIEGEIENYSLTTDSDGEE